MPYMTHEFKGARIDNKRGGEDIVFRFHIIDREDDGQIIRVTEREFSLCDYIDARTR